MIETSFEIIPIIELDKELIIESTKEFSISNPTLEINNKITDGTSTLAVDWRLVDLNIDELYDALNQLDQEILGRDSIGHISLSQISLGTSAVMTAGYAIWATRGGVLLSTILSTMPAWRRFDPLIVITKRKMEKVREYKKISTLFANARKAR